MSLTLLCVGRLKSGPERELFDRYWGRCKAPAQTLGFGQIDIRELRESADRNANARKVDEAERLQHALGTGTVAVAFDERGTLRSTLEFCKILERYRDDGRAIALIIGGPDGLSSGLRETSDTCLSFGRMTMPHQLVRVLVAEQLYRSLSLLQGHPYHRA